VNNARLIEREVIKKLVSWLFLTRKERNCRERKLVELLVLNIKGARARRAHTAIAIAALKALFFFYPAFISRRAINQISSRSSAPQLPRRGKRKRNSRVCLHRIKTVCVCRWAGVSLLSTPEHLSHPPSAGLIVQISWKPD
jgi:hypothetical protein